MKETTYLLFKLRGHGAAHIGLLPAIKPNYAGEALYEFGLGTWSNTKALFRKVGDANAYLVGVADSVSNSVLMPYWVSWKDHIFSMGTGDQVGQNILLTHDDRAATPMAINYLGFASWGSNVNTFVYNNGK